jgi:hypothetical protein
LSSEDELIRLAQFEHPPKIESKAIQPFLLKLKRERGAGAGDTMSHYGPRPSNLLSFDPTSGAPTLIPFTTRAETRHNFQFAAGIGWRF